MRSHHCCVLTSPGPNAALHAWPRPSVLQVKVHAFRIAEAKEVLQQLGLAKHGRKEELSARILTIFQDAATL